MKALTAAVLLACLALTASCESTGRSFFASVATLDSDADGIYDAALCEAAFALGALLSDPNPEQNVTGSFAAFDPASERLRLIAYGPHVDGTHALVLQLEGGGDFIDDSGDPEIVDAALGAIEPDTLTLHWGVTSSSSSGEVPVLPAPASFDVPATIAVALTLSDTGLTIVRGAGKPLYELDGEITIGGVDCTSTAGDENIGLDFVLELTGILAYEDELGPIL